MAIDSKKILNISAEEWFKMNAKYSTGYDPIGVHSETIRLNGSQKILPNESLIKKFADIVPSEAEVVVNYKVELTSDINYLFGYAVGTALIQKGSDNLK
jgi:hypothetical protein